MPAQDTAEIKEKIIQTLNMRGPSLPIHIANIIKMNTLFTSAFLSELVSERKIKISNMRVGSSPIYYLEGQESKLETFSQHLNEKEREALELLKQKKFLKDLEQTPVIRVALRAIKDFAVSFQNPDTKEIFWRFFTISEEEFKVPEKQEIKEEEEKKEVPEEKDSTLKTEVKEKRLDIFDNKKEYKKPKKKAIKTSKKDSEKFFNEIKEFLNKNSIEFLDIIEFGRREILLKVKKNETELLAMAFNKKRITETDIIKAGNKSKEIKLPYIVLSKGEVLKKITNLIEAINGLSGIKNINEKL